MALSVKIVSCIGVLEYWSVGKSESPNFNLNESFHYSITPLLHHAITPADCRKGERRLKPFQGAVQSGLLWARILYLNFTVGESV
jgi:hypothetical protein